jgi:iron complex outermembrane receptor protein/outer membrane receptor for ferrienterochelin and colicins
MYKMNNKITMRMGGGAGYKTPSLFSAEIDERDYHYIYGYAGRINSEKSVGANFDINYKTKIENWDLTLNQTVFYNEIDNPIELFRSYSFSNYSTPLYYFNNAVGNINSKGLESYFQAMRAPFEIYAGYVYTDANRSYSSINKHLPLIANHKFATVFAYEFSEVFKAGIESSYTGKQYLDNGASTSPYLMAAIMLRYTLGKASFVLNCENLFDERQNKNGSIVRPPFTNPSFPEIWAPLDGRVINLSMHLKW